MIPCITNDPPTPSLNLNALLHGIPAGAWVAISQDHSRVITFGAEMRDVLATAKTNGEENPLILRVPETEGALIL